MHAHLLQVVVEIFLEVVLGETIVEMMHYDSLDGKTCSQRLFGTVVRSDISCMTMCRMTPPCLSSFYIQASRLCIGCDSVYWESDLSSLMNEQGSLYYRPYAKYNQSCSPSKPCAETDTVCFSGLDVCVCDSTFVYDPSSASCKFGCITYGLTYQIYPNRIIMGHDLTGAAEYHLDLIDCLFNCSSGTFSCYSVNYSPTYKQCWYIVDEMVAVPLADWEYSTWTNNYVRNCA